MNRWIDGCMDRSMYGSMYVCICETNSTFLRGGSLCFLWLVIARVLHFLPRFRCGGSGAARYCKAAGCWLLAVGWFWRMGMRVRVRVRVPRMRKGVGIYPSALRIDGGRKWSCSGNSVS